MKSGHLARTVQTKRSMRLVGIVLNYLVLGLALMAPFFLKSGFQPRAPLGKEDQVLSLHSSGPPRVLPFNEANGGAPRRGRLWVETQDLEDGPIILDGTEYLRTVKKRCNVRARPTTRSAILSHVNPDERPWFTPYPQGRAHPAHRHQNWHALHLGAGWVHESCLEREWWTLLLVWPYEEGREMLGSRANANVLWGDWPEASRVYQTTQHCDVKTEPNEEAPTLLRVWKGEFLVPTGQPSPRDRWTPVYAMENGERSALYVHRSCL